jgi:hypothetical protein
MGGILEEGGFRFPDIITCVCGGEAIAKGLIFGPKPWFLEEGEEDGDAEYARYICQNPECGRWTLVS